MDATSPPVRKNRKVMTPEEKTEENHRNKERQKQKKKEKKETRKAEKTDKNQPASASHEADATGPELPSDSDSDSPSRPPPPVPSEHTIVLRSEKEQKEQQRLEQIAQEGKDYGDEYSYVCPHNVGLPRSARR